MTTPPLTDKEKEENGLFDQALNNLELEHETINVWGNADDNRHSKNKTRKTNNKTRIHDIQILFPI